MNRVIRMCGVTLFILCVLHTPVQAQSPATYYIDSIQGGDSQTGTSEAKPWKSLAKLKTTKLKPGDSIRLKRGSIWREPLDLSASGSASLPITITSYGDGNDQPTISGMVLTSGWTQHSPTVWKLTVPTTTEMVHFNGEIGHRTKSLEEIKAPKDFFFTMTTDANPVRTLYVYATDNPAVLYANPGIERQNEIRTLRIRGDYVHVSDIRVVGGRNAVIYQDGGGRNNFNVYTKITVWGGSANGITLQNSNDVTVENSHISYNEGFGIGVYLEDYTKTSKRNIIRNNHIHHNSDAGIRLRAKQQLPGTDSNGFSLFVTQEQWGDKHGYNKLYENDLHHNGDGIYIHQTRYNEIYKNKTYRNTNVKKETVENRDFVYPTAEYPNGYWYGEGEGIALQSASNNFIYDNISYENPNCGIHLWGRIPGVDNINGQDVQESWGLSRGNIVYRNRFFDNGRCGILLSSSGEPENLFAYNLVYRNGGYDKSGNALAGTFVQAKLNGNKWVHNTFVKNRHQGFDSNGSPGSDTLFANNIVAFNNTEQQNKTHDFFTIPLYNNCFRDTITIKVGSSGYAYPVGKLDEQKTRSFDTDPLFLNSGGDDYRLQAGSKCAGTGIDLTGLWPPDAAQAIEQDSTGTVVQGQRDIGAFSVSSDNPTVTPTPTGAVPTIVPNPFPDYGTRVETVSDLNGDGVVNIYDVLRYISSR